MLPDRFLLLACLFLVFLSFIALLTVKMLFVTNGDSTNGEVKGNKGTSLVLDSFLDVKQFLSQHWSIQLT
jgi:hypothetical protein